MNPHWEGFPSGKTERIIRTGRRQGADTSRSDFGTPLITYQVRSYWGEVQGVICGRSKRAISPDGREKRGKAGDEAVHPDKRQEGAESQGKGTPIKMDEKWKC